MEQKQSREERFAALEAKKRAKEGLRRKKSLLPTTPIQTPTSRVPSRLGSPIPRSPVAQSSRAALFEFMDDDLGE